MAGGNDGIVGACISCSVSTLREWRYTTATAAVLVAFPFVAEAAGKAFFQMGKSLPFTKKCRVTLNDGQKVVEGDIPSQGKGYQRPPTTYRSTDIPAGDLAEGRFVLVANHGCPWAHRAIIARKLLGLEEAVPLAPTVCWETPLFRAVLPAVATGGWRLASPVQPAMAKLLADAPDPDGQKEPMVYRLYLAADPHASGRVTVPCLMDTAESRIVNNESKEVLRLLNGPLRPLSAAGPTIPDLRPDALCEQLDELIKNCVYVINNGVYRVGFGGTAKAQDEARLTVFQALDKLEKHLTDVQSQRYLLTDDNVTEVDIHAFTTLLRFDLAYYNFFRVDTRTLRYGYPAVHAYLLRMLEVPQISETVDMIAYVTMYGIICQWEGRVAGNMVRAMKVLAHFLFGAQRPDAPMWRRTAAQVAAAPWTLLSLLPGYK